MAELTFKGHAILEAHNQAKELRPDLKSSDHMLGFNQGWNMCAALLIGHLRTMGLSGYAADIENDPRMGLPND